MAASKPTSWLSGYPHILVTLSTRFGTLAVGLGCFPLDYGPSRSQSHSRESSYGIRSLVEIGRTPVPRTHPVLYPHNFPTRGCTSMHFGENQLSPNSISFSLLSTAHPSLFQQTLVRSSSQFYLTFNLAMDRSSGFGSTPRDLTPYSDSVSLRLQTLQSLTLPRKVTRWLIFQEARRQSERASSSKPPTACKHTVSGLFTPRQGCFSPFPLGTVSLSVANGI